jgi:putative CocE/NonD family hydrolase
MRVEKDVYVAMRDDVALATDLYSPDSEDCRPALLMITPYSKDPVRPSHPLDATGRRVPIPGLNGPLPDVVDVVGALVAPYVEAGFVVAVADARGSGFSEGAYDYYNLEGGSYDGYDLVEWLADQPWCSGKVGVMGTSAGAIYAYLTAIAAPPHLGAMAANMHPGDFYFDQWRIGGVFRWDNRIGWALALQQLTKPIDPGDPAAPSYERKRAVYESRVRHASDRVVQGRGAVDVDWLTDLYHRDRYDEFWQRHSLIARAAQIRVPTLHGGVWFDHFIRGTLTSHAALDVAKKLIVAPGSLSRELLDGGYGAASVAWFEHHLLGRENGVDEGPSARVYVTGAEEFVDLEQWPVATVQSEFFLGSGPTEGMLTEAFPTDVEAPDVLVHDPQNPLRTPLDVFDQSDFERSCLTYTTAPLNADLTVLGSPTLVLYASTDAPDVDWCVRLCDVDDGGRSRLLNTGALKGSHVRSHEHPEPLRPGEVYRFEIEIWPVSHVFRRGHRVRVDLSASDYPFFEVNRHPSRSEIRHDAEHASKLTMPERI